MTTNAAAAQSGTVIHPVSLDAVASFGDALNRPECVLCTKRGDTYVSDKNGGIRHLASNGVDRMIGPVAGLVTNGFALLEDGTFAVANLADSGGVWILDQQGQGRPMLTEVDGIQLPSVNFVWLDHQKRLWVCVSTVRPGEHTFRKDKGDGVIIVMDDKGARVVADGIHWANECRIDASGQYFYVNETFGRKLLRFRVGADGSLHERTVLTEFGHGTYPDGMAIDVEGGIWIASVVSNRLIRVMPDGSQQTVLEDCDPNHVDRLETEFSANRLTRQMVYQNKSKRLGNITSIAFAGADLRTAYLGSINDNSLAVFQSPVAGIPPIHWGW